MEDFKKEVYKNQTGKTFPVVEINDVELRNKLIDFLYHLGGYDLGKNFLFKHLANKLPKKSFSISELESIEYIFRELRFNQSDTIYVIWNEKEVDKFSRNSLIELWEYVWYGEGDEAVILMGEKNDILLFTHYGDVHFSR